MSSNTEALQVLASETKKLVQDLLGSASFDVTRKGKITEVLDNNKYSVNIDGTVYTVPSCVTTGFAVNDTVLVISCQNDAKKNYIIGKSNAIKGESDSITADMLKSVYDVNGNGIVDNAERVNGFTIEKNVPSDAVFTDTIYTHPSTHSADIIVDGSTNKAYTATEKAKLAAISGSNTGNETATTLGSIINAATEKTTPVDADMIGLMDSAASNIIKKLSWSNIKATLKTYFDSFYSLVGHSHTAINISDFDTEVANNSAVSANTAKVTNATHTGDVTGSTALTVANGVISNAKMSTMPTMTIKGNDSAGALAPQDLTASEVRTLINVEDGATADMTASEILTAIKTVDGSGSGLDSDLLDGQNGSYFLDWSNATNKPDPVITLAGDVTGSVTLTDLASSTLTATVTDNSHNHIVSNVTDFDTEVSNNTDVVANTSARHAHSNKTVLDNTTASFTTADETKLDGIAIGANNYVHPAEHAIGVITGLQTALDGKVDDSQVLTNVPAGAVFTDTIYTHPATHNADIIVDGTTNKAYTATEKTKLSGIANSANNYTHPSTHSADIITDGTTNKAYTATEKAKLSGVATGATVNDTDINLKNRANHTGTQPASTISDFNSAALTAAPAETVVSVGALVNGAIAKNTPADVDMIPLMDSADSNKIKKLSWAYVKSVLSSTFAALVHTHTVSSLSDLTATATELNYTDGVTSAIQTQLNTKAPIASPTFTGTVTAPSFSGALSGNATTASRAALLYGSDTRSVNSAPSEYMSGGTLFVVGTSAKAEFKSISTIGVSSYLSGTYCFLMTYMPWTDSSGGYPVQVAYGNGTPCWRAATSTTVWGAWTPYNNGGNADKLDGYDASDFALLSSLATVATSGSYTDLLNTPIIPALTDDMMFRANDTSIPAGSIEIDANLLDGYDSSYFINMQITSTQPTTQRNNDVWFQII